MKRKLKVGFETHNKIGEKVRLVAILDQERFPLLWVVNNKFVVRTTLQGYVISEEMDDYRDINLSEFNDTVYCPRYRN